MMSHISSSRMALATSDWGFFMPPNLAPPNASYDVSVVNQCGNLGTYAIQCTAGGSVTLDPLATCGPHAPVLTVTEDMTDFTFATRTTISGVTTSITETCTLIDQLNTASCVANYGLSTIGGTTTQKIVTALLTDAAQVTAHLFPINFTGGVAKLTNVSLNTCSGAEKAASLNWLVYTTSAVLLGLAGAMLV